MTATNEEERPDPRIAIAQAQVRAAATAEMNSAARATAGIVTAMLDHSQRSAYGTAQSDGRKDAEIADLRSEVSRLTYEVEYEAQRFKALATDRDQLKRLHTEAARGSGEREKMLVAIVGAMREECLAQDQRDETILYVHDLSRRVLAGAIGAFMGIDIAGEDLNGHPVAVAFSELESMATKGRGSVLAAKLVLKATTQPKKDEDATDV